MKIADIQGKIQSKKGQCWDRNWKVINTNDVVKIMEGPNQTIRGTILHVYKDIVFLHNKQMTETLSVFVEKARSVQLMGDEMYGNRGGQINTKFKVDDY